MPKLGEMWDLLVLGVYMQCLSVFVFGSLLGYRFDVLSCARARSAAIREMTSEHCDYILGAGKN